MMQTLFCTSSYTGKERDQESGLDYFGARYYGSNMGRFMSPDPSNWGVDFYNPQTWNHYSYVGNNPLSNTDPNGLWLTPTHNSIINNAFPGLSKQERNILQASSKQVDTDQSQEGSYKHGMSSEDNDASSSTGAYNPTYQTNDLIEQNEHDAKEIQADWLASGHTGIAPAALAAFGNAAHTIADEYSPAQFMTPGVSANLSMNFTQDGSSVTTTGTASIFPSQELNVSGSDGTTTPVFRFTPDPSSSPFAMYVKDRKVNCTTTGTGSSCQ